MKSISKLVLRRKLKPVIQYNPSRAQQYNRAEYSGGYWARRKWRSLEWFQSSEQKRQDVLIDAAYCLDSMVELGSKGETP